MLLEQLIFTVVSVIFFVNIFFKLFKNNDNIYIGILVLEVIGMILNIIEALTKQDTNILIMILKYILAVIIPLIVIILEKRDIKLGEIIITNLAKILVNIGNEKKAKQILVKLTNKDQNSYMAHILLAKIYEKEGGARKAIDEYVKAMEFNKQDYDSYYKVASLLKELNRKEDATEMLNTLLSKKPDMEIASTLLGDILVESQMYKEAVNVYLEAMKYSPRKF